MLFEIKITNNYCDLQLKITTLRIKSSERTIARYLETVVDCIENTEIYSQWLNTKKELIQKKNSIQSVNRECNISHWQRHLATTFIISIHLLWCSTRDRFCFIGNKISNANMNVEHRILSVLQNEINTWSQTACYCML